MSKKTLYGETEGVIVAIGNLFKVVHPGTNTFDSDGLVTDESTINSISLPYEFDGETFTVHYPEADYGTWIRKAFTDTSKFYGYSYDVRTKKMLTMYGEKSLKKVVK